MYEEYNCKIATIEEIESRWQTIIDENDNDIRYQIAADEFIKEAKKKTRLTYIGKLNNHIICDATAIIKEEGILNESQNKEGLVSQEMAFICGVRTNKEYENLGYFSKLYKFMEKDLKEKGYNILTLSVESTNSRGKNIYKHLGFTNYLRSEEKSGHILDYYYKNI